MAGEIQGGPEIENNKHGLEILRTGLVSKRRHSRANRAVLITTLHYSMYISEG